MFSGSIVWRGFVYAIFMLCAKSVCGCWLIRLNVKSRWNYSFSVRLISSVSCLWPLKRSRSDGSQALDKTRDANDLSPPIKLQTNARDKITRDSLAQANESEKLSESQVTTVPFLQRQEYQKPRSLYPGLILGSAMVARGEIGFLICAVAQSSGIFTGHDVNSSELDTNVLFLVVTWAVLLCTVIGPLMVGLLVTRVRRLHGKERTETRRNEDVLGQWGVS